MSVMVEMTKEDANNLDEVVHELGIEDSAITPAEAVRKLKANVVGMPALIYAIQILIRLVELKIPGDTPSEVRFAREALAQARGHNALTEAQ